MSELPHNTEPASRHHRIAYTAGLILVTLFLAAMGVLLVVMPKEEVSEVEKRPLADFPRFTTADFWNGNYMDSLDMYVADHFPFRENFVSVAFDIKAMRGYKDKSLTFYAGPVIEPEVVDTLAIFEDTTVNLEEDDEFEVETLNNNGLLISDGRALQIFGGSDAMARAYARVVNLYQEEIGDDVDIYACIVPTASEFYAPKTHRHLLGRQSKNIEVSYAALAEGVTAVEAHKAIGQHTDEYIYFRTDHHWTGLGAYYAYAELCRKAGLEPVNLSLLEHKMIPNFLGAHYTLTKDAALTEKPDTVHYWKIPGNHRTVSYRMNDQETPRPSSILAEYARGPSSYGVFLGNDWPLMVVKNDVKNGRRGMVVKNSFGNPFAAFLAANYEVLVIVDYRYCTRGVIPLIREYGVTDLIFLSNAFATNTSYHLNRTRKVMYGTGPRIDPADTITTDTTIIADTAATDTTVIVSPDTTVPVVPPHPGDTTVRDSSMIKPEVQDSTKAE